MQRHEYKIEHLPELAKKFINSGSQERIIRKSHDKNYTLKFNYPAFSERGAFPGDTTEMDNFETESFFVEQPQSFMLRDAVCHTEYGLVSIDDFLIKESLFHFPWFRFPDFQREGRNYHETSCSISHMENDLEISDAYSLQAGIQENYYHWLILFLGRLSSVFLNVWEGEFKAKPVLLLPFFENEVQRQSATALAEHFKLPIINILKPTSIKINRLLYPLPMRSGGLRPHPIIKESFAALRNKFYQTGDYPKKVYISRKDTKNRPMLNEVELELYLEKFGYKTVTLTNLSFSEQVNIFAHAEKIISPHGAGLTNIVFSDPGTALLEIAMPSHLNWCYRRLAEVFNLNYGYFYGEIPENISENLENTLGKINRRHYVVDLKRLATNMEALR